MVIRMRDEEIKVAEVGDIKARFEGQKADRDYLRTNYKELLEKYRNQWVVISGGKLIKVENDPDRLMEALRKTKTEDLLIFYLADPEDFMIL